EESTSTLWQRDLSSETCYKAAWLAKNMCESCDRAVFGYWLLTDLMEERATLETVFHGGYGLLTYNGIPKAGYQAMRLISRMGNTLIASGEGWLLTKSSDAYQLLAYNYCHYSRMYRYRYKRLDKPQEAYSVFETGNVLHMLFQLDGLPRGTYHIERRKITQEHGSSFDQWIKIGTPRYPTPDEQMYLIAMSQPIFQTETAEVSDVLQFEGVLRPLEVEFIYFYRMKAKKERSIHDGMGQANG
ncbi:MAG: hypothetical protein Q4D42_11730, partial [Eubacteriales bacterium]|nr:hypothetical protein [Eubacteriales bacterium]